MVSLSASLRGVVCLLKHGVWTTEYSGPFSAIASEFAPLKKLYPEVTTLTTAHIGRQYGGLVKAPLPFTAAALRSLSIDAVTPQTNYLPPKPNITEVQAGGRAVRVSSPDRIIYEATERTPEVTKLMVAQYVASAEDGLMRALRDRPTALERWPSGVREGMRLATGPQDSKAEAFYQKRVPKGAPDYLETATVTFPAGRTAELATYAAPESGAGAESAGG